MPTNATALQPAIDVTLQQAINNTHVDELNMAITNALHAIATEPNVDQVLALQLLNTLARVSPTSLSTDDLHNIDLKRIRAICFALLKQEKLQKLQADLHKQLTAMQQQNTQQQAAYAKDLAKAMQSRHGISTHKQELIDEANFIGQKAIEARRDKAFYDVNMLGHIFETLLSKKFLVPIDEKYYERGFKFAAPTGNEYLKHISDIHGGREILNSTHVPFMR